MSMPIHVELFGIVRKHAGVSSIEVEAENLGEVLVELGRMLPQLQEVCLAQDQLKPGYLANINGRAFVTDTDTQLTDGDSVLILSADAGG
jgi:sulfur-carrier protein